MRRIGTTALAVIAALAAASNAFAQERIVFDGNILWPNNAATQLYNGAGNCSTIA